MTIYTLSVITSTGYPYFHTEIKTLPKGIKLYLRFFDFTQERNLPHMGTGTGGESSFALNSGLVSALFEFARSMDKKIRSLEFKSRIEEDQKVIRSEKPIFKGDVLITSQTEMYLLHTSFKQKVKLIYDTIIASKIPLDSADSITDREKQRIIEILTDLTARDHVFQNQQDIKLLAEKFLKAMGDYGLESIVLTSFDLSPIMVFGKKYSFTDIEVILRNIGEIPEVDPLEWKYRQSILKGAECWIYICNAGIGVTVEDQLFEPYFYLLIADPQSYLADFPAKLMSEFNLILG
jgi:hypothetical protein